MSISAVTIFNNEIEYKPTLRNSISSVFQAIQFEVFSIIEFFGHTKSEYIINSYPLSIERVDGKPVSELLIGCIKRRLRGVIG